MFNRTYKSGCLKRKERKEKEINEKKDQKLLTTFGFINAEAREKKLDETQSSDKDKASSINENLDAAQPELLENNKEYSVPDAENSSNDDTSGICQDSEEISTAVVDYLKSGFDIGSIECEILTIQQVRDAVKKGPMPHPLVFPADSVNSAFPTSLLQITLKNNERVQRDWLVWSTCKQALFCFPCRLFSTQASTIRSNFSLCTGYPYTKKWKKLYDRIPAHEQSNCHKECYMKWRILQKQLQNSSAIFNELEKQIESETELWKKILQRLLHVTLFLGERGLAFRGHSRKIGDPKNGNFLGILELLSLYDPLLSEHLKKVRESQLKNRRLQAHYLSDEIQNEFINCIAAKVRSVILKEREMAKYYSIILDATPDSAHMEQTTFILRYVSKKENGGYEIEERFLEFADCNKKTGHAIANLIISTLEEKFHVPISDCRGQGYDNGSNMSGVYKGAQAYLLSLNPTAKFSPCACHSLNLCGVQAAESCPEAMTFFGIVHQLYNLFSRSPQRWEILKRNIDCSLHGLSDTRWSARVDSIKPIVQNLDKLQNALEDVSELNLSSETSAVLIGIQKYLSTFECLMMSSIWIKILVPIDQRNKILQARNATIDVEIENLQHLIEDLDRLRDSWDKILSETKTVASTMDISSEFKNKTMRRRKRKRFDDEGADEEGLSPENDFKVNVFFKIIDTVRANILFRYEAVKGLENLFGFLWKYTAMTEKELEERCTTFINEYKDDVTMDLIEEMKHLKVIHPANISDTILKPLDLLNKLAELNCTSLFPNCFVALRLFLTLPVTVAEAERSFSVMARIKNCLRSTMGQGRLSDLGILAIESDIARKVDFDEVILQFANSKARKVLLTKSF